MISIYLSLVGDDVVVADVDATADVLLLLLVILCLSSFVSRKAVVAIAKLHRDLLE